MKIYRHHTAVDVIDLDDQTGHWVPVEKKPGERFGVGQMAMAQRVDHSIRGSYTIESEQRYSFYWNEDNELVFRSSDNRRYVLLRQDKDGHLVDLMPEVRTELLPATYGDGRAMANMSTFRLIGANGVALVEVTYDSDRYLQYYLGNTTFVPDEDLSDWDFFVAVKGELDELKLIARAAAPNLSLAGSADVPLVADTGARCIRAGEWVVYNNIGERCALKLGDVLPDVEGHAAHWVWVGEAR